MKKNISVFPITVNSLIVFGLLALLNLSTSLTAAPNYYYASINAEQYRKLDVSQDTRQIAKIEGYLQKTVPGLPVSYREVIDTLIAEGLHVYLKGGATRDLLSLAPCEPQDIDINYSGCAIEDFVAILDKYKWTYTRKPDGFLVTIGDHRGRALEASPVRSNLDPESNPLEVSINKIFYDCNTRKFLSFSKEGLNDLSFDRLNIVVKDIERSHFYTESEYHTKIFRFWKMVGKGYVFSTELAEFFYEETLNVLESDPETFLNELFIYLGGHYYSFDDLRRGCIVIMGYDWAQEHVISFRKKAKAYYKEVKRIQDEYTYNRIHNQKPNDQKETINCLGQPNNSRWRILQARLISCSERR
ncbi:MAG: hypothetical protein ACE5GN_00580 [Waddliaceae bacterium]